MRVRRLISGVKHVCAANGTGEMDCKYTWVLSYDMVQYKRATKTKGWIYDVFNVYNERTSCVRIWWVCED
jgi:hypothetical protein